MDFSEEQKLNSPQIRIIYLITGIAAIMGSGWSMYADATSGESITALLWVPLFLIISLGFGYYMLFMTTLETQISSAGITYRYFPFVKKPVTIPFAQITGWKYKTIKSIFEYGGYGYKKNVINKKTAFIMGGKDVFEFNLQTGKTIAFTSESAYLLQSALKKYMAEKEIR